MKAFAIAIAFCAIGLLLHGCAVVDRLPINPPGTPGSLSIHRYSVTTTSAGHPPEHPQASNHVFIGISISGGGTRAANFGLAVLRELEEMGVLEHATVMSSVSGGSVANAFYALKGVPTDDVWKIGTDSEFVESRASFWKSAKQIFVQDFRTQVVRRYLRPDNFLATLSSPKTRTDVLSEVLDEQLFDGFTFKALRALEVPQCKDENGFECIRINPPFHPQIRINATIRNELPSDLEESLPARSRVAPSAIGQPFSFTDVAFDGLRSDIRAVRVSDAVAASAAFPGVFSDVSLAAYLSDGRLRGYVKLSDGGTSDNLGTEALIDSLTHWWDTYNRLKDGPGGCLLIVVDAFASGTGDAASFTKRDSRSWYDRIVDTNFLAASDSLLARRRELALEALGVPVSIAASSSLYHDHVTDGWRKVRAVSEPFNPDQRISPWYSDHNEPATCGIWRISLDDVSQHLRRRDNPAESEDEKASTASLFRPISAISWLTSRTATDFDLVGPKRCSAAVLQDALWDAATILIHHDWETREKVCTWLSQRGIEPRKQCSALPERTYARSNYPVKGVALDDETIIECTGDAEPE